MSAMSADLPPDFVAMFSRLRADHPGAWLDIIADAVVDLAGADQNRGGDARRRWPARIAGAQPWARPASCRGCAVLPQRLGCNASTERCCLIDSDPRPIRSPNIFDNPIHDYIAEPKPNDCGVTFESIYAFSVLRLCSPHHWTVCPRRIDSFAQ